jgi:uncharacterized protein Veg
MILSHSVKYTYGLRKHPAQNNNFATSLQYNVLSIIRGNGREGDARITERKRIIQNTYRTLFCHEQKRNSGHSGEYYTYSVCVCVCLYIYSGTSNYGH